MRSHALTCTRGATLYVDGVSLFIVFWMWQLLIKSISNRELELSIRISERNHIPTTSNNSEQQASYERFPFFMIACMSMLIVCVKLICALSVANKRAEKCCIMQLCMFAIKRCTRMDLHHFPAKFQGKRNSVNKNRIHLSNIGLVLSHSVSLRMDFIEVNTRDRRSL